MVLANPSELAEISFQFIQSHLRCLCSPGLLRSSFLLLFQPGSPALGSPPPALGLQRERQTPPHQRMGSALQIALMALLKCDIHWWQLPTSPTEDFTHELQLAHFQEDLIVELLSYNRNFSEKEHFTELSQKLSPFLPQLPRKPAMDPWQCRERQRERFAHT